MRSGFVTLVGRPNAGKSTLINQILGTKISIVSDKPQTTRLRIMGVLHRGDSQIVFVDTPGIHKPITQLGERLNETANAALNDVDVACLVIDATAPIGRGDRLIADGLPPKSVVVITKCDIAAPDAILAQLSESSAFEAEEYFPVSGVTGQGIDAFVDYLDSRMSEGPAYFPPDQITDLPEPWFVAELVREQLLSMFREELPYSIATRITEWDWPRIRCEILVERESQKGMVIGRNGDVLKKVGTAARHQLQGNGEGIHLELNVKVEKDWQKRRESLDRLLDFHEPD